MRDLALSLAGVVVISWIFVRVSRDEIAQEKTATEEMRARTLEFYKAHLDATEPDQAARDGAVLPIGLQSRIAGLAATTNNTRSMWE